MINRRQAMLMAALAVVLSLTIPTLSSQRPSGIHIELTALETEDGDRAKGAYYYLEGTRPRVALLIMHPRNDTTLHFILKPLARNGMGAMGMVPRSANHSGIHEELVLDVAAGVKYLKSQGAEHVILAGHSGGGSLMAYYQAQAETAPPNRVRETPAGDPPNLNNFEMPGASGLVTMNAAKGQGLQIAEHLDPSVIDESDPFSYDPSLDAYHPDNGWRVPPEESRYTPEFVERFRKAQQERAWRLVEIARSRVREQNFYRDLMKSPEFQKMDPKDRLMIERRAQFEGPMLIWRTRSDVRYFDLSLDPSDRTLGHYAAGYGRRSDLQNWAHESRLRSVTPRAFLSTESIVSNASMWDNLGKISIPTLVINSSADPGIHREQAIKTFEAVASRDKERVWILGGNHGFLPEGLQAGDGTQREQVVEAITRWAKARWPW